MCEEEGLSFLDFTACGMAAERYGRDKPALGVYRHRMLAVTHTRTKICSLKDSGEVLARTEIVPDGGDEGLSGRLRGEYK